MGAGLVRQEPDTPPLHVPMHTVQQHHQRITQGEDMTKEEALQAIKLLSALESWAFSTKNLLPDYLHEELHTSMEVLGKIVLEEKP
jgi:hypothetical protein